MDTSDIVKLFFEELGSDRVDSNVNSADRIVSSAIAYVESHAALAAGRRDGAKTTRAKRRLTVSRFNDLLTQFEAFWSTVGPLSVSTDVIAIGSQLAHRHSLSGSDAIHLASAMQLRQTTPESINFSVDDSRLAAAARSEGFVVV